MRAALPGRAARAGEPFADVLRDLDELIVPALTHWNHPRFFAYFAITGSEPGILAELLIAALNVNAMAWVDLAGGDRARAGRARLARRSCSACPRGWHGHIEDTASTSTLAALAAARELRPGGVGLRLRAGALLGREGGADPRARVPHRRRSTTSSGCGPTSRSTMPTAVVATVGTTSSTSVDPVPALADRCDEAGVWLHVDAAYAGSAAVCPELRWCLDGCDRADSIVVNPHKWLFTPVDCSALWTRRPEALRAAFAAHGRLPRPRPRARSTCSDYGPALGRRFRALKLWTVLRCYGREGLQALIREHVRLAALFEEWVRGRAGLGDLGAAALLDRLLPPRERRQRRARAPGDRDGRDLRRDDEAARAERDPARDRQRAHARRPTSATRGRCCANARGDLRPLGHARRVAGRRGGAC